MNKLFKGVLTSTVLLGTVLSIAAECNSDSPTLKYFNRRSDSRHKYIQMVSRVDKTHLGDAESMYGVFTLTPGYRSSFRPKAIAEALFGGSLTGEDSCASTLLIQGSAVADRNEKAWLADYFYLPRDFSGSIKIKPEIKTFFLDLDLYVGLDDWLCGSYFRIWGDLVHTSWKLGMCEAVEAEGSLNHPTGYFSPAEYEASNLLHSFENYAAGKKPDTSSNVGATNPAVAAAGPLGALGNTDTTSIRNASIAFQSLNYARMTKCSHTKTGFADLRAELGWDFWQSNCYHLGLNLQMAAPTGGKVDPKNLFDAVVGNGNHWEIGGGLTGHYNLWTSEDSESTFSFHVDANITHLFKTSVDRTFDLKNKPNSAYMLAAKFGPNTATNPADQISFTDNSTGNVLSKQFAGEYAPVANLSTVTVDVSVAVQADIVAMFNYTCGAISWDLGYNYFGRSCEKLDCAEGNCKNVQSLTNSTQLGTWALKGDARMFGYVGNPPNAYPLSASQSGATITNGLNKINPPMVMATIPATGAAVLNPLDINTYIDAPIAVFATGIVGPLLNVPTGTALNTSKNPVFLKASDLDYTRIKGNSHTIFTNVSYTFDRECWVPHVGVGFAAEFGSSNSITCDDDLSDDSTCPSKSCVNAAVSQWSIWLQGGVSFN